jgi:hypothetical protein
MGARWLVGVAGMVVATSLAACSVTAEEAVGGDRASVTQAAFDKNAVLTDTALRDTAAMSADDIQAFLEKTPWGHPSVLATYEEDGKTAAEIMHEAATKHGINPLELLVRVQMEQSLVYKKTASAEAISIAFGCGCPHSPVCSSKYEGFANQADCAAGTLSRSMDRALTSNGTASGWKKGEEKLTQDSVEVVPTNAATAALYTYTPWVGEAGGGRKGIGGASLHYQVWNRFADATGYGITNAEAPRQRQEQVLEAGAPADDEDPNNGGNDGIPGETETEADAGPPPKADSGTPGADAGAGSNPSRDPSNDGTGSDGADDDDILSEGNAPPANDAPPPRQSGSRGKRSSVNEDLPEATEEELAGKKKMVGGCSSTGGSGNTSDASLIGLAMVAAAVVAKRRRQA